MRNNLQTICAVGSVEDRNTDLLEGRITLFNRIIVLFKLPFELFVSATKPSTCPFYQLQSTAAIENVIVETAEGGILDGGRRMGNGRWRLEDE